jgi:hypothetical protein
MRQFRVTGRSRWFLAGLAIAGVIGLVAIASLRSGETPSYPWDKLLFLNWWLSVSVGLALGLPWVLYTSYLYRRHHEFYARFYAAPLEERRRRPFVWRNLLYWLPPLLIFINVFIWLPDVLGFSPFTAMLAMLLPLPLLISRSEEVQRDAEAIRRSRRDSEAKPPAA